MTCLKRECVHGALRGEKGHAEFLKVCNMSNAQGRFKVLGVWIEITVDKIGLLICFLCHVCEKQCLKGRFLLYTQNSKIRKLFLGPSRIET